MRPICLTFYHGWQELKADIRFLSRHGDWDERMRTQIHPGTQERFLLPRRLHAGYQCLGVRPRRLAHFFFLVSASSFFTSDHFSLTKHEWWRPEPLFHYFQGAISKRPLPTKGFHPPSLKFSFFHRVLF